MPLAANAEQIRDVANAIRAMQSGAVVHIADVLAAILQGSGVTIDRSVANQITISATGTATPPSFGPTSLAGAAVTFNDRTWKSASSGAIPATATWIFPTAAHSEIGAIPPIPAAQWRTLTIGAVNGMRASTAGIPLKVVTGARGLLYKVWLGRTVGNVPLLAYDGGGGTALAANVAIYYT